MEAPDPRPLLINQLAIEQSISEAFREPFRERQRQRGFRLVIDLTSEEAERAREESPTLAETQPERESQEERHLDEESDEEVLELIKRVKRADPNSEEFWEGRIALLFGQRPEGHRLKGSAGEFVHAKEGEEPEGVKEESDRTKANF
jgi:hypothetical protein